MRKITGLLLVLVMITSCDVYLESDTDQVTSITDASGVAYGATASGGSNEIAPVFYDGTQWIYS